MLRWLMENYMTGTNKKPVTMFALHMHIAWTFYILSIYMYALFHHFNKNIVSYLP